MKINSSKASIKDASNYKISIIISRFNDEIGFKLLSRVTEVLIKHGINQDNLSVHQVPGALEIPFATNQIINAHNPDAVITLGIVIKGDTYHFEVVCNESYRKLMDISIDQKTPVVFGILTVNTVDQALQRVATDGLDKGEEFAIAALEMIQFNKSL